MNAAGMLAVADRLCRRGPPTSMVALLLSNPFVCVCVVLLRFGIVLVSFVSVTACFDGCCERAQSFRRTNVYVLATQAPPRATDVGDSVRTVMCFELHQPSQWRTMEDGHRTER